MSLPSEIATALGSKADGADCVRLRSGVDTPTGESHLVVVDGALRVFARASMLDPLVEVSGVAGASVVVSALRSEVQLDRPPDLLSISLGFGEAEKVEALLGKVETKAARSPAAPTGSSPLPTAVVPETPGATETDDRTGEDDPTAALDDQRGRLLGVLDVHRDEKRRKLKRAARKQRERDREREKKPRPRAEPVAQAAHPRAIARSPAVAEPAPSKAPWVVLAVLLAIGIGAALRRLALEGG